MQNLLCAYFVAHRNNKNYSVNKTKSVCFSIIFFRIKIYKKKSIAPLRFILFYFFFCSYSPYMYVGIGYIKFTPLTMSSLKYINKLDVYAEEFIAALPYTAHISYAKAL